MNLTAFQDFLSSEMIYRPDEIPEVMKEVRKNFRFSQVNRKEKYFNVPCAFDIETSSFSRSTGKDEKQKTAIMYEWTFGIYGLVIIGRTWDEFIEMIDWIVDELKLHEHKRLLVYVHNLGYEFQFIRKHFKWGKVFSIDNRKPIYAVTTEGIEFRCSYLLSGYSLVKLGDELRHYPVKKLVGALDYEKIRHSKTVLTDNELKYCVNDVKVVMSYIAEQIETIGTIAILPITKTGYVRNYCRNSCFYEPDVPKKKSFKKMRYMDIIKGLRLSPEEYKQLKRAFQGGFTHANPFYSGKVVDNVTSFDFTSSYPAVMISEKFPMSSGQVVDIKNDLMELKRIMKLYCCVIDIEYTGIISKLWHESYISESRCWLKGHNIQTNNGRIVSADIIRTTITEQDYMIIEAFYTWKEVKILKVTRYKKDYLPTDFIKAILKLYSDKTTLKGVEGKEIEYLKSKEMLNSCYGMTVTDIVRPEYVYTDDWQEPVIPDYDEAIGKYNNSKSRFLFYPWGVWVTAYARRNLFTGIMEFSSDYVYSDTDSIKALNAENHMEYIERYNATITDKLHRAMKYHDLPMDLISPETIKGDKKFLGIWDFDGHYRHFKTLGAKRYMVQYSDDNRNPESVRNTYSMTVSGLNKKICMPYLLGKYGESGIFDSFNDELYIPSEYTGKNTHTYIDDSRDGKVIDYLGVESEYHELSGVHLEKSDYSLKLSKEYLNYLLNIESIELG